MNVLRYGSRGIDVQNLQRKLHLMTDGIFGHLTEEAVKEFQKTHNLRVDGIAGAETLNAMSITIPRRNITEIIVHCSATPEGKDYTVAQIREWHLARGFSDIGYHYVIYRDGSVHAGREEAIAGAHCKGHNPRSIGVCYIGGEVADGSHRPKDTRTAAQKASLLKLLKDLKRRYPQAKVYGHRDFAAKACPCFDATSEFAAL